MIFFEWGLHGIELLRDRVEAFIIVDVLSFSTTVDIAVERGATVFPFAYGDENSAKAEAQRRNAILAYGREKADIKLTLSPKSMKQARPGDRILLPSPNGSRLSLACQGKHVLAGCLRNCDAVAKAAREMTHDEGIAVIAAGEPWQDGSLRMAIEDMLGAGAIIDALKMPTGVEAEVIRNTYLSNKVNLATVIKDSLSGRELINGDFSEDVEIATDLNASSSVPLFQDGCYRRL